MIIVFYLFLLLKRGISMKINECLNYQTRFFNNFNQAWQNHSDLMLYKQIDNTAENLRLDISEVPGYILAYDQQAQQELHDYLQEGLIAWLKHYLPFFEINHNGVVMFGNWYHRRRFGVLDTWRRKIIQTNADEQSVIPELEKYAEDPKNYLDNQIKHVHDIVYDDANSLKRRINKLEKQNNEAPVADETSAAPKEEHPTSSSRLSSFFANLIDDDDKNNKKENTDKHIVTSNHDDNDMQALQDQYSVALADADERFINQKRAVQVEAAVVNYEYQAIMSEFSSFNQFLNALLKMPQAYTEYLEAQEGVQHND